MSDHIFTHFNLFSKYLYLISSITRQEVESQKSHTCAYQGVLCFLETPVLRFALLPYYRRFADFQNALNLNSTLNSTTETKKIAIDKQYTYLGFASTTSKKETSRN